MTSSLINTKIYGLKCFFILMFIILLILHCHKIYIHTHVKDDGDMIMEKIKMMVEVTNYTQGQKYVHKLKLVIIGEYQLRHSRTKA